MSMRTFEQRIISLLSSISADNDNER